MDFQPMSEEKMEEMLDRAARRGARQALAELGLHDSQAVVDINEMRSLLTAWRETRKAVWATVVKVITVGILGFIGAAVWMYGGK
tara:strand:+ start:354 stop:608 length:255 start_codon:yes stop_codon:yes gene_type:complete